MKLRKLDLCLNKEGLLTASGVRKYVWDLGYHKPGAASWCEGEYEQSTVVVPTFIVLSEEVSPSSSVRYKQ
ncbi:hypothetical protein J6590_086436 [Homalodisca vitripennis]|nr:hypothetical protein J6590_086436 [Homalodisca vitripennis]